MEAIHIIKQAFLHISRNMTDWIKAGLAPMVLAMIVGMISQYFIGSMKPEDMTIMTAVYAIFMGVLSGFFGAMALMQMYRFGIMDEKPTGWINLHFNRNLLRFVMYYVLFMIIIVGITVITITPAGLLNAFLQNMLINIVAGLLAALIIAYVFTKFILMIPAAAIGNESPIKTAMKMSKGNMITMVLAGIFFTIVIFATGTISAEIINMMDNSDFVMILIVQLFSLAISMVGAIIAAAGLCTLYKHLLAKAE